MPTKTILILANSVKKFPGRCIAGREVTLSGNSITSVGPWVRPVSTDVVSEQGELYERHFRLQDGTSPQVLDVVKVPLVQQRDDDGQPENWEVASDKPWTRVCCVTPESVADLCESPEDLWIDTVMKKDRIAVRQQLARPGSPSLVLIQPSQLRINMQSVTNTRGTFRYKRYYYRLKITDDVFIRQHAEDFSGGNSIPPFGDRCALCISLGTPFSGYSDCEDQHYKLIAAIIPTQ